MQTSRTRTDPKPRTLPTHKHRLAWLLDLVLHLQEATLDLDLCQVVCGTACDQYLAVGHLLRKAAHRLTVGAPRWAAILLG